jgi:hypothetical protein
MSSVSKIIVGTPIRRLLGSNSALGSLANVTITSVQNGQIIVYNSATSEWENASLDSGEGLNLSWDSAANKWTLSAEFATTSNPGIASFNTLDFSVTDSAAVSVKFDAVPESLIPATDSAYDLGSAAKKWKDLYLSGNTIYIGGGVVSYDSSAGELKVAGNTVLTTGSDGDSAIRALFSADGVANYNPINGLISVDSARVKNIFSVSGSGGLTYDSASGQFSDSDRSATQIKGLISADGKILGYNSSTGVISADSSDIRNIFSASGSLSYDSATGQFSYTDSDRSASSIKGLFSASGSLSYDSSTGQFSYTDSDRSATQIKGLLTADGKILGYNSTTGLFSVDSADIRNIFSVSGDLSYDSSTGQFSYTDSARSAAQIKGLFSAAGDLSYNSSTGEFSYTDSDRTANIIKGMFSATGGGLSYDSSTGQFTDSDRSRSQLLGLFSASGSLSYDNSTGIFSYTDSDRSAQQIKNLFTTSGDTTVLSYNSTTGAFSTSLVDSDLAKTNANDVYHEGITIPDTKLINFADSTGSVVASLGHSSDVVNLNHDGRITITSSANEVRLFAYDSVRVRATNIGASINGRMTADSAFVDGVKLSTTVGHPAYSEGLVWYDNIHKTLNYYGDDSDVVFEIGIEEHQRVYNNTGADIAAGKPLYFSGNYNPGGGIVPVPTVGLADATDVNAYNAQGLSASIIADGTYGYMIRSGLVEGFDTSGLTAGQNVFVGLAPGLLQNASPTYPNYPMCIGWVVKSDASNGVISINQQNHSVNSFRVRTDAHIGNNLRIDGNLTVVGTQTITSTQNINIGGSIQYLNAGNTIGEAGTTFVGTGLDDAFFAGHYSGDSATKSFYVKIDATGTPDTFEWGFDSAVGAVATGVAIDGTAQMLDSAYNISIDFGATTGHTLNDKWTGTATATNVDTGLFSNRNAGSNYTHVGMYFDVSTNKWTFLNAYDSEPGVIINPANGTYGAIKAATYEGNLTGNVTGQVSDISNHTTTNLAEGSNLYYTDARARNALKVGGTSLSYDSSTGELSYSDSDRSRAQVLGLFSASGSLSYNNSTGNFSYTDSDRSRAQILGLFSAGGNLSYNSTTGQFSYTDSDISGQVRGMFSVGGDLAYDSATGQFSYTDSDRSASQIKGLFTASSGLKVTSGLFELDSNAFTPSVRAQISGDKGLTYNSSTGVMDVDSANIKGMFSVTDNGGDGSLSYSNGVITYTGPSASEVRAHLTASGGLKVTSGLFELDSNAFTPSVRAQLTGNKGLAYNSSTGEFNLDSANVRGIFSGAGDITYNSGTGEFSYTDSDRSAAQIKGLFTADGKILGYNNTTGLFTVDSADISNIITADVDKTFVDALNVDADTLDGQQGTYYRINVYNAAGTLLN